MTASAMRRWNSTSVASDIAKRRVVVAPIWMRAPDGGVGPGMTRLIHADQLFHGNVRIFLRCRQALVAQQFLDRPQVGAFFQHVRSEGMAECVRMNIRGEALGHRNSLYDAPHTARGEASATLVDQYGWGGPPQCGQ